MRRRLAVLPAAVSALLLLTSPVAALGTLDQQQTTSTNQHAVFGTLRPAQIFTAGLTGQLDHVDLDIDWFNAEGGGPPPPDLTVEIWTVAGGVPGSPIPGASATVTAADAQGGGGVQVAITAPSVAGTAYAIVLASPTADCVAVTCWIWLLDESAPYPGGAAYNSGDGGATWNPIDVITPASDFAFATYVTPPAPSVAPSLPNAATAQPAQTSPLTTLGFGLLLISSLGVLVVANVRSRAR